jgi:hypothetical protein
MGVRRWGYAHLHTPNPFFVRTHIQEHGICNRLNAKKGEPVALNWLAPKVQTDA